MNFRFMISDFRLKLSDFRLIERLWMYLRLKGIFKVSPTAISNKAESYLNQKLFNFKSAIKNLKSEIAAEGRVLWQRN